METQKNYLIYMILVLICKTQSAMIKYFVVRNIRWEFEVSEPDIVETCSVVR